MARLQSLRDKPNTARKYETIYILKPGTANEGVAEINARVKGVIEGMGGKIVKVDNWGKRRLAYEVAKERKGIYLYWQYLGSPGIVEETERNLRLLDTVIRYLTIKVENNVDFESTAVEIDDASFERAATTAADEEDLFLKGNDRDHHDGDDDDDEDDYVYNANASRSSSNDSDTDRGNDRDTDRGNDSTKDAKDSDSAASSDDAEEKE